MSEIEDPRSGATTDEPDRRITAAALISGMRERTFFGEAEVARRVAAEMIRQRATLTPVSSGEAGTWD